MRLAAEMPAGRSRTTTRSCPSTPSSSTIMARAPGSAFERIRKLLGISCGSTLTSTPSPPRDLLRRISATRSPTVEAGGKVHAAFHRPSYGLPARSSRTCLEMPPPPRRPRRRPNEGSDLVRRWRGTGQRRGERARLSKARPSAFAIERRRKFKQPGRFSIQCKVLAHTRIARYTFKHQGRPRGRPFHWRRAARARVAPPPRRRPRGRRLRPRGRPLETSTRRASGVPEKGGPGVSFRPRLLRLTTRTVPRSSGSTTTNDNMHSRPIAARPRLP